MALPMYLKPTEKKQQITKRKKRPNPKSLGQNEHTTMSNENNKQQPEIKTFGELKQSGYRSRPIKEEVRTNLVQFIQKKQSPFNTILGYEDSVIPDVERALLSRHNILFLGL